MKRIIACGILALSLMGLCACGETPQQQAARRLDEANRSLANSKIVYEQAIEDLNELKSMWADYQYKKNELEAARP